MSTSPHIHDEVSDAIPLSVALPPDGEEFMVEEEESFPTVDEVVPKNPLVRHDFPKEPALALAQNMRRDRLK